MSLAVLYPDDLSFPKGMSVRDEGSYAPNGTSTYLCSIMPIVHSPPSADHLVEGGHAVGSMSTGKPRLVGAYEVYHVDTRLKVPVSRNVLVMSRRSNIVRKAQAMEAVLEVHVQQALVSAVERDAPLSHSQHGVVIAHIGCKDHDASVEDIGPADVGCSCERMGDLEELVGGSVGNYIGVNVNDSGELALSPEIDFCERRVKVCAIHEVQVGRLLISYSRYGEDIIIYILYYGSHYRN